MPLKVDLFKWQTNFPATGNVWDPLLVAELANSYKIPEEEVNSVLKFSEETFLPSIMRKDVVAAPPPPAKPKYPYPPYVKLIVNALPAAGGCSGAGTTCVVCAMVSEGGG